MIWLSKCQPSAGPVLSGRIKDVKWNPPEVGSWKLNVDAATLYKDRSIGLGIIIRNGLGGVSAAKSTHLKAMYSPIIAEALAVWHGLLLAGDHGLTPCLIELDSLQVVEMINKGIPPMSDVGPIISMICGFLRMHLGCGISHIPRNANFVAHSLAKAVLSLDSDCYWLECCPPCVERLVLLEASG
ncbi:hypothetical protein Q3G72_004734 [Acer saccharum]|nr:hypothetical protein Q3G72_004734 [Acer saccharum]